MIGLSLPIIILYNVQLPLLLHDRIAIIILSFILMGLSSCNSSQASKQGFIDITPTELRSSAITHLNSVTETSTTDATINTQHFLDEPLTPTPVDNPKPSTTPAPPVTASGICTPLEAHSLQDLKEIITNPYNPPTPGQDTGHHGVDFAYYRRGDRLSILGVKIQSVLRGKVVSVIDNRPPYGYMIIIETGYLDLPEILRSLIEITDRESVYLLYAHMNSLPLPSSGDFVECGQVIGEVGNTPPGWSSAPHLHLEGRIGPSGMVLTSMAYYTTSASQEELDTYRLWRMSDTFQLFDPMVILQAGLGE
jgi:murein DD-endopeptidase MepM/ murein hydrolase activator NlpD